MAHDGQDLAFQLENSATIVDLLEKTRGASAALKVLFETAREQMKSKLVVDGKTSGKLLEDNQDAAHGLAWLATYSTAMHQMQSWAEKLESDGEFGEIEQLLHQIGCGEYHAQVLGGIPMSQGEIIRLGDIGLLKPAIDKYRTKDVLELSSRGNNQNARTRLVQLMQDHSADIITGKSGLDDELEMIREQFRKFSIDKVLPHAHEWHLNDDLIPMEIIEQLAELGVFGLTIPEEYGGFGLSKASMAVVSEELSRGYIGVGSLGTRSEIAAELIECGGTEEQKQKWLPKIAMAEILPTAVFTEPNTGSDLGSLRTRAVKDINGDYKVTGNKTWITHASRTHVMTLLARTDPDSTDHRGLSMFLAEKIPGDDENPFPTEGMSGGEIEVLGYRGMKEYEIAFDNFLVKKDNLLGGEEGKGFRQLMKTFESARIQTAARAVGVAQQAIDLSFQYAIDRKQFGKALIKFPRVASKLAMMAVETTIARQLTYYSAFEKDNDRRCDLEAGMAKLLGARVAWAAADNGLQIHGGNGFALEYQISRVLCDARILNIFEGAAEIQAQVITRRLME
ncbi:acyl-CoA/acyl-ACP dehydrogenase [Paracoccaceae bacterium]|nr:acyl-CoA/acyl-ACP dehydrogenase [Paracoccaceae bacterium]MDB3860777.1 acyl-CoA/acyl-ACP dehydrogenase [Paracoccaceae bacterium]